MNEDTATRLLQAAERILIEQGVHALTVRRVGTVSGLNPTLVTYHFGGVSHLLAELCRRNLEPMLQAWGKLGGATAAGSLDGIMRIWLAPLLGPAAFTPGGRALVVLDEIAAHGDAEMRGRLFRTMVDISSRVHAALTPLLPHLDAGELRARLRFVAGAALGPPPRARITDVSPAEGPGDGLHYLCAFAEAALLGKAA
jgi:AcrR family transcriptional regulator